MSTTQARSITTNQTSVHEDLIKVAAKHKQNKSKRPVAEHTRVAFKHMLKWLAGWHGDVIIDACCGVGESTINIATEYPNAKIIGIDKSVARLGKHQSYVDNDKLLVLDPKNDTRQKQSTGKPENYLLLQADLNDFWRLLLDYTSEERPGWRVVKQFILYPNPYPKKSQLGKRWHGSALFPCIIALCSNIEVRSNWRLYIEEFLLAAEYYDLKGNIEDICRKSTNTAYTPFERKYLAANQTCFKLVIRPSGSDK
jgi:tRNA G46 methylase TrmB